MQYIRHGEFFCNMCVKVPYINMLAKFHLRSPRNARDIREILSFPAKSFDICEYGICSCLFGTFAL